ncbi:MAG: hypothetical protein DDT30_01138 [Dehalococcoidia bacterium]|nr:hypothetical protein [Bacillota bacterium]
MDVTEELMYFKLIQGYFEGLKSENIVLKAGTEIRAISSTPARYMVVHPKKEFRILLTNMTGRMILDLCRSKRSIGDIRDRILSELPTGIDPALVLMDIVKFVRMAEHHGILRARLT